MRVLLVDADSQKDFPNLALMKISSYLKENEHAEIDLMKGIPEMKPLVDYDAVYISCIFFQNRDRVTAFAKFFDRVELGGSGISLDVELPYEIEHILPDYELYDIDYSLGFTSRGCIRKCDFCIVPEKEGRICDNAHIDEFLHPSHSKLILLDNNFLASPRWKENMEEMIDRKVKVNFNQGLDIRLINEENAKLLHEVKYHTWKFNTRRVSFAYDSIRYSQQVEDGIQMLKDNGISLSSLSFYVLVGYDSSFDEDMQRVEHLLSLGVDPYIMRYNKTNGENRLLMHFSRWVNWRIHRTCSFWDYDYSDSQEVIQEYISRGCPQRGFV